MPSIYGVFLLKKTERETQSKLQRPYIPLLGV